MGCGRPAGGGLVATHMILDRDVGPGAGTGGTKTVGDDKFAFIATSFPGFADMMRGLGADMSD